MPLPSQGGYPLHVRVKGQLHTVFIDPLTSMPSTISNGELQPSGTLAQTYPSEEEFLAEYPSEAYNYIVHEDKGSGLQTTIKRNRTVKETAAQLMRKQQVQAEKLLLGMGLTMEQIQELSKNKKGKPELLDAEAPPIVSLNEDQDMDKALDHMKILFAQYKVAEGGIKAALKLEIEHVAKAYMVCWPDIETELKALKNSLKEKPFSLDED